jgi:hypothetical protein
MRRPITSAPVQTPSSTGNTRRTTCQTHGKDTQNLHFAESMLAPVGVSEANPMMKTNPKLAMRRALELPLEQKFDPRPRHNCVFPVVETLVSNQTQHDARLGHKVRLTAHLRRPETVAIGVRKSAHRHSAPSATTK